MLTRAIVQPCRTSYTVLYLPQIQSIARREFLALVLGMRLASLRCLMASEHKQQEMANEAAV